MIADDRAVLLDPVVDVLLCKRKIFAVVCHFVEFEQRHDHTAVYIVPRRLFASPYLLDIPHRLVQCAPVDQLIYVLFHDLDRHVVPPLYYVFTVIEPNSQSHHGSQPRRSVRKRLHSSAPTSRYFLQRYLCSSAAPRHPSSRERPLSGFQRRRRQHSQILHGESSAPEDRTCTQPPHDNLSPAGSGTGSLQDMASSRLPGETPWTAHSRNARPHRRNKRNSSPPESSHDP